jgi:hypothetical protein
MGEPLTDEERALWDDPRVIAISNEVARHHAEDITVERDHYLKALREIKAVNTMDVGHDYIRIKTIVDAALPESENGDIGTSPSPSTGTAT